MLHEELQPVLSDVEESNEEINLPPPLQIPELICATHQRHCATELTQLWVKKPASWSEYMHTKVFEEKSRNMAFYSIVINATGRDKIVLFDTTTNTPLFNFKCHHLRFSEKFSLHKGGQKDGQFCRLVIKYGLFKIRFTAVFEDVMTGEKITLFVRGNRWPGKFRVYYGDPKENGEEIARINHHKISIFSLTDFYHLIIKPGVDTALVTGFCLILDDYMSHF